MHDLDIEVSDRPVRPDQYRFIAVHAWSLGTFDTTTAVHYHLSELRVRQWIPARPEREWLLDREVTGAQRWLTGSAADALAAGFDLRQAWPVGRFRARYGRFETAEPGEIGADADPGGRDTGGWDTGRGDTGGGGPGRGDGRGGDLGCGDGRGAEAGSGTGQAGATAGPTDRRQPGAALPGATVPGAALPGAALPGATVPGATVPGSAEHLGRTDHPDGDRPGAGRGRAARPGSGCRGIERVGAGRPRAGGTADGTRSEVGHAGGPPPEAGTADPAAGGGRDAAGGQPPTTGNWRQPTPAFFDRLPREPATLLAHLCEDNPGSWFGPFAAAVTALRTCLVPAELRAALYRALTGLPGVRFTDRALDLDGRACLALVHDAGRTRTELLIDGADGQFAGERDTLRADSPAGLPAGTVISSSAVDTAVVDRLGQLPAG